MDERTRRRGRATAALFVWAALAVGCGNVRSFNTNAVYDALKNGYRIDVTAAGTVPMGQDLNPTPVGKATITPLGGNQPTVVLDISGAGTVQYTVGAAAPVAAVWDGQDDEATLRTVLKVAGYACPSAPEVQESAMAIGGVLLGPKSTLMPGQTKHLSVVSVKLR